MSKKYNSKKNIVLGNILKTEFENDIKRSRTYKNTNSNWKELEENKSKEEKNNDLLKYSFEGNKKLVKMALEAGVGADINTLDKNGNNALMLAVYSGDLDTVKYLLNFHKDIKGNVIDGITPIELNHLNDDMISALHLAVHLNNANIVKVLLDAGVDANVSGKYKETPLMFATRADNVEMIELLLTYNKYNSANIEQKNREGHTALIIASQNRNRQEAFLKLLKLGANYYAIDAEGKNALMHSANNNCSVYLDILLKQAGDNVLELINSQDKRGISPLMILAKRGNREALRVFISRGADIYLKDKYNHNAEFYAERFLNPTCKEILIKANKIYETSKQFENELEKYRFLQNELSKFAKQNRVENSCIK